MKYDKEYRTQYLPEVDYLKTLGIKAIFVKTEKGIDNYKYTKTQELFNALSKYYK